MKEKKRKKGEFQSLTTSFSKDQILSVSLTPTHFLLNSILFFFLGSYTHTRTHFNIISREQFMQPAFISLLLFPSFISSIFLPHTSLPPSPRFPAELTLLHNFSVNTQTAFTGYGLLSCSSWEETQTQTVGLFKVWWSQGERRNSL